MDLLTSLRISHPAILIFCDGAEEEELLDAVNQKFYVSSMRMSKIIVGIVYCWETMERVFIVVLAFIFTDEY